MAVNGYDERLQSYGYDDTNLHERLNALPLHGEPLRYDYVQHLWHDDSVRAVEERDEAKKKKAKTDGLTTADFNRLDKLQLGARCWRWRPPSLLPSGTGCCWTPCRAGRRR